MAKIRSSATAGNGLFAREPINEGEVIEVIGGVVMNEEEFLAFRETISRYNAVQISESLHLVEGPTSPGHVAVP